MKVYWTVWIITLLLACFAQQADAAPSGGLTAARVRHTPQAKTFFVLAALLLIFIAGCRYYVGADFGAYYRKYQTYIGLNNVINAFRTLEEPGIRIVYTLACFIHESPGMCVFAVAAVTLALELSVVYKNTDSLNMALMLFVFTCWASCFNGVRQALAAAVLFCGYPALRDRDFKRYALTVVLAFLCHRSAIVMILVYFMVNREANARNIAILVVASVVVLLSYDRVYQIVNIVLDNEVTGDESYWGSQVNILRTASKVAPAVFFLIAFRNVEKSPLVSFYLNILVMHAIVAVTTANSACLARMSLYTAPFALMAIVELVKIFPLGIRGVINKLIVAMYWYMEWYECSKGSSLNSFQLRWFW